VGFAVPVKIKVSSYLRRFTDGQEYPEVTGNTPLECLHDLELQFPAIKRCLYDKWGDLRSELQLFVNGQIVNTNELNTSLKQSDELFLLVAIGGG
jgi:molybdopterin converting factor small subunit